jgi:hypothetical protein
MKVQVSSGVTDCQRCSHSDSDRADDVLELGDPSADLVDLGELRFVLDDHRPGVGVLENVLALLRRVGLIDRDDGGAHAESGEVEVGPLGSCVGQDRDLVALLDPELDQAEGETLRDLADLAIGLGHPLAGGVLVGDGAEIAVPLRGERHQVGASLAVGARLGGATGRWGGRCLHLLLSL